MFKLTNEKVLDFTLKNLIDGSETKEFTSLRIKKDGENLTVIFTCFHKGVYYTPYSNYNDPVYRGEVVEFFIGNKNSKYYFEFDLSQNDTLYNARVLLDEKYGAFTKVIDEKIVGHKIENHPKGYIATMIIPLSVIQGDGNLYMFNAYRISIVNGSKELQSAFTTQKMDFHVKDKFSLLEIE